MVLLETNKPHKLFHLRFLGHVTKAELAARYAETGELLGEFSNGFRVISDLTGLDKMDGDCRSEIGRVMELCEARGMESIVRVIPDPKKDIGFNILTLFHYSRKVHPVTCQSLEEALKILGM